MKKTFRKIQFLSNVATIIIALLLSFVVIKQYIFPSSTVSNNIVSQRSLNSTSQPSPKNNPEKAVITPLGKSMPLEDINWKENKKTLVLYVSTTCHFCNESSPFYKQLVEKYSNDKNVKLVAVMPQSLDEAKGHLKDLGVNITDVYSTPLSSIGVTATPTLLLVNESGMIMETWRGKLSSDKEEQVLSKLSS